MIVFTNLNCQCEEHRIRSHFVDNIQLVYSRLASSLDCLYLALIIGIFIGVKLCGFNYYFIFAVLIFIINIALPSF